MGSNQGRRRWKLAQLAGRGKDFGPGAHQAETRSVIIPLAAKVCVVNRVSPALTVARQLSLAGGSESTPPGQQRSCHAPANRCECDPRPKCQAHGCRLVLSLVWQSVGCVAHQPRSLSCHFGSARPVEQVIQRNSLQKTSIQPSGSVAPKVWRRREHRESQAPAPGQALRQLAVAQQTLLFDVLETMPNPRRRIG